jgi:hypothetical protein
METEKVGVREFRDALGTYLESDKPVAVTKHGRTVGFYIPVRRVAFAEDVAAFREAGKTLHALMAEQGISEDELVEDFKRMRQEIKEIRKRRG